MIPTFKFGRLDSSKTTTGFHYTKDEDKNASWEQRDIDMSGLGSHWSVTIKNYTKEPLYSIDSLMGEPKKYESISAIDPYRLSEATNMVSIDIRYRDNERDKDGRLKTTTQKRVSVSFPAHVLQAYSVYVKELGLYFTVGSRITATRELIAQSNHFNATDQVTVPESMMKANPGSVFQKYEPLIKNCIDRIDRIRVRVGHRVDVDPRSVPTKLKNMRIAVLDNYFSPYASNKMVYDELLSDDEFVVENIHLISSEELLSTFDRLNRSDGKGFFLDTQEYDTIKGPLCGLAIFADKDALSDYVFSHKSDSAYEELMEYVGSKNGSPIDKRTIEAMEREISEKTKLNEEQEAALKHERGVVRDLKRTVTNLEESINKIRKNHEASLSYEAVMEELSVAREKLEVDKRNLKFAQDELNAKIAISKQNQSATIFKSIGEILKSGWAIASLLVTICGALYGYWNKLNPSKG